MAPPSPAPLILGFRHPRGSGDTVGAECRLTYPGRHTVPQPYKSH